MVLFIFALSAKSSKAHLNFAFHIQIPYKFQNRVILLQNKTKYGLVDTKGLILMIVKLVFYKHQKQFHKG